MRILLHPFWLIWRIYRFLSSKYFRVTIYMKSGNKIVCDCKKLKIDNSRITWTPGGCGRQLVTIQFEEIEAIVSEY